MKQLVHLYSNQDLANALNNASIQAPQLEVIQFINTGVNNQYLLLTK